MKLKVQRNDDAIIVGGCIGSLEDAKIVRNEMLIEEGPNVYEMAINILQRFPRFKEVIINTELTEDGEVGY